MRILHTADWHLGRTLEGRSRQVEQEAFVDELCEIVAAESVNMVLIAGDIFDTVNPPAAAEELYCEALARLGDGGRRAVVVIAGNHDQPERLCAVRALARRHGIVLFGYPQEAPVTATVDSAGSPLHRVQPVAGGPGWVELAVPGVPQRAVVAALPYPSEARLGEVLRDVPDESELQLAYSERVGELLNRLSAHFRPETVNVAISHLFVAGGRESDSERPIQLGGAYTVSPSAFPANAQYVALGHLHRPQDVAQAPTLTRYAGSPLAYSFSEAGQAKSVTLVDLAPASTAGPAERAGPGPHAPRVQEIPLRAGRPVVRWQACEGIEQVVRWCEEGKDRHAWIDLELHVPRPLTLQELQTLRQMNPGFVHIRPVLSHAEVAAAGEGARSGGALTLGEQFAAFYASKTGGEAPEALVRLFLELAVADEPEEEVVR